MVKFRQLANPSVVGYMGKDTNALKKPSFGACFVPVDGSDTYKLGDFKPTGFDPDADLLQVINPTTLAADAAYAYLSKEVADAIAEEEGGQPGDCDALIGWWDAIAGVGEEGAKADSVDIAVGKAFLGLFESGENITFTSSGAVNAESISVALGTAKKPFFANLVPATIKLGQILPSGFDPDADLIQVINPSTLGADAAYAYLSKEVADAIAEEEGGQPGDCDALIGWWDAIAGVGEEGAKADDLDVAAGAAFLGLFESGNELSFAFPTPIVK